MAEAVMHPDTLIVFALESEARGLFDGLNISHTGVGKINAAYGLTSALARWKQTRGGVPARVLNLGSAGSMHFKTGSVVNLTGFIQRDFDVTALGFEAYVTPFENTPAVLPYGVRIETYPEGVCGTGDSFVADGQTRPWNVVDMEAYALAKICALEKITFICLKYITDGADADAAGAWETRLVDAARALRHAVDVVHDSFGA